MAKRTRSGARRKTASRSAKGGGSLLPWIGCGTLVLAAIWFHDHPGPAGRIAPSQWFAGHASESESKARATEPEKNSPRPASPPARDALALPPNPSEAVPVAVVRPVAPMPAVSRSADQERGAQGGPTTEGSASFGYCGQGEHINCVADGATFWFKGDKITLADVASPRIDAARCDAERRAGFAAKARLLQLLNAGRFNISAEAGGRVVSRGGRSLGQVLIGEGLARQAGGAANWCA